MTNQNVGNKEICSHLYFILDTGTLDFFFIGKKDLDLNRQTAWLWLFLAVAAVDVVR